MAQVEITGPDKNTVAEGGTAEYEVEVRGYIQPDAVAGTIVVTLAGPTPTTADTWYRWRDGGHLLERSENSHYRFSGERGAPGPARFSSTGVIRVQTTDDTDAEDEKFTLGFSATVSDGLTTTSAGGTDVDLDADDDAPTALTIADDEDPEIQTDLE